MKKHLLLLLVSIMLVTLVGCGQSSKSGEVPKDTADKKEIKIGFAQMCNDVAWKIAETNSVKAEIEKRGYQMVFTDAQWKTEKQVADMEDLITQGVDYILLAPNDYEGYTSALESAKEAGIPVIVLDREVKGKVGVDFVTCISSDFVWEGQQCAKWLQAKKGEKGGKMRIVEITGTPGASVTRDRSNGFKKVVDADKDMEIIVSQVGDFDRATAEKVMTNIIQSTGGKFDAVYCHDDEMSLGAIKALKAAGIAPTKDVFVVAIDGQKAGKESIEKGELSAVVTCTPVLGSYALEAIDKLVAKEKVEPRVYVTDYIYDASNIKEYKNAF